MEYVSVSVQYMQEQRTLLLVRVYKFTEPVSYFKQFMLEQAIETQRVSTGIAVLFL